MTGLTAANHAMDALPGDRGRRADVLQTEPDEPQVRSKHRPCCSGYPGSKAPRDEPKHALLITKRSYL